MMPTTYYMKKVVHRYGSMANESIIQTHMEPVVPCHPRSHPTWQKADLKTSVEKAKAYISGALAAMLDLGKGSGPMNHAFAIKGEYEIQ